MSGVVSDTRRVGVPDFLRDRAFLRYAVAQAVSYAGDQTFFVALGWAAARLGSPLVASLVLAAGTIPRALLMLPGGAAVDRYGPRRLMLGSDLVRAAVMAVAAVVVATASPGAIMLGAIALVFGIVDAVYMPSQSSMPRLLLGRSELTRVSSFNQILMRTATLGGGPLGGFAVAYGGFTLACVVNAVSFLVVFGVLLSVRVPARADEPVPATGDDPAETAGVLAGLRHLVREPVLLCTMGAGLFSNIAISPVSGVAPPLRAHELGWSAAQLGTLTGAIGLGAMLAGLVVLLTRTPRRQGLLGLVTLVAQGACGIAYGLATSYPLALGVAAVLGWTFGYASATLGGITMGRVDKRFLGRTASVLAFTNVGLVPVAYVAFGAVAGVLGVGTTMVVFGAAEVVFMALLCVPRALRTLESGVPADERAEPAADDADQVR